MGISRELAELAFFSSKQKKKNLRGLDKTGISSFMENNAKLIYASHL